MNPGLFFWSNTERHNFAYLRCSLLVAAAYAENTPHSSLHRAAGLLCSDALHADLFMSLCKERRRLWILKSFTSMPPWMKG